MSSQRNMTDMLKRRGRKSSPTQHSNTELVNFDVLSLSGMSERGVSEKCARPVAVVLLEPLHVNHCMVDFGERNRCMCFESN